MIKLLIQKISLLTIVFITTTIFACSSDDKTEPPQIDIEKFKAQITAVEDVNNNRNASDILVLFDGGEANTMIESYRLFVAKNSMVSDVDIETALGLTSNRYTTVPNDQTSHQIGLMADQNDFDGNAIEENNEYVIFILTKGTFNNEEVYALSDPSNVIILEDIPLTSTLVSELQANDALSIDAEGNIYVSNYGVYDNTIGKGNGQTVLKVSVAGEVSTFASGLSSPVGNAIDQDGNFYVNNDNDFISGDLLKISPDGTRSTIATIEGYPAGLLLGNNGNIFVSNYAKPVVNEVTPSGTITAFAVDQRLAGGVGIAYDDNGNIIVGNYITGDILSISDEGVVSLIATLPTVVDQTVIGYITFFDGYVYATGNGAKKVYRVSLAGEITEFAGDGRAVSIDGELSKASFAGPNGIVVDKNARVLYVSDAAPTGGSELRKIPIQ